ncbi:MAG: hypothetical protein OXC30_03335 [Alphaproteobacteria bacterium]|nr:hypothetical protein [Alphaproteobacteria bacterium]
MTLIALLFFCSQVYGGVELEPYAQYTKQAAKSELKLLGDANPMALRKRLLTGPTVANPDHSKFQLNFTILSHAFYSIKGDSPSKKSGLDLLNHKAPHRYLVLSAESLVLSHKDKAYYEHCVWHQAYLVRNT